MIFEGIPFAHFYSPIRGGFQERAIYSILNILERKLRVTIAFDANQIPFNRPELLDSFELAKKLKQSGVIASIVRAPHLADEPRIAQWNAVCGDKRNNPVGGSAWKSDANALTAALAEALERYIWLEERDYFVAPVQATHNVIQKYGASIAPERFVAFSPEQREKNPGWRLDSSSTFLWTRGISLVSGNPTYVPAQTITAVQDLGNSEEPLIRHRNTTGLATWPTQSGARLAGALEVVERDAYMIMWLNQLALPRISLEGLCARSTTLSEFVGTCARYRLKVHALQLLTDAPAHAVCVILEDESGHVPRFSFGMKAHRSLTHAVERATTEALRARFSCRRQDLAGKRWDPSVSKSEVGHYDRILYWGAPENAKKLEVLLQGKEIEVPLAEWENDTPDEHLQRIVSWCRDSGYECVSVSLGTSKKNPTPWSIEMVVIPELQPMHLSEKFQQLGGERWKSVPQHFDITPREKPFTDEPHPFA